MIDDEDFVQPRKKSNSFHSKLLPNKDNNNNRHNDIIHRSTGKDLNCPILKETKNEKIISKSNTKEEDSNDSNIKEKIIDDALTSSNSTEKTKEIEILFTDPNLIDNIDNDNNELIYNTSSFQKLMTKIGLNTYGKIIISLAIINICVSSLNLSQKMVYSSIYIYPALIIAIGIFSHWTSDIMLKIYDKYKRKAYDVMIKKVIIKKVMSIYIFFIIINNLGNIILEEIILYKLICDIIVKFDERKIDYFSKINIKYYILYGIALILLFPLFQFADIQYYRQFLIFEIILLLLFAIILISNYILLFMRNYDIDNIKSKISIDFDNFLYPKNELFNSIVVLFYCFSNQDNILQLFEKIRNPSYKQINKIIKKTICIDIIIYLIMACLGFFCLPFNEIKDLIIFRNDIEKEFINDYIMTFGRIIYFICILFKLIKDYYKIKNIILINICGCNIKKKGAFINIIISLFTLLITTLISIYFQNISDCICLIGAFCSTYISFIIPLILYIIENEYSFCNLKNIVVFILIIILFIISSGSLFFTLKKII